MPRFLEKRPRRSGSKGRDFGELRAARFDIGPRVVEAAHRNHFEMVSDLHMAVAACQRREAGHRPSRVSVLRTGHWRTNAKGRYRALFMDV